MRGEASRGQSAPDDEQRKQQKIVSDLEMDAFASKKGGLETEHPFEDAGTGSPEDAAALAKLIKEKGIETDLGEMRVADTVEDLVERFKKYEEQRVITKGRNFKEEARFLDETETAYKEILALNKEVRKNPAEPGALDRVNRLMEMAKEVSAIRDEVKIAKQMLELMEKGREEQARKDYEKEIAQPSVIVDAPRPERKARGAARGPELPEEEGAGVFEPRSDGTYERRGAPKKPGFFARIFKRK